MYMNIVRGFNALRFVFSCFISTEFIVGRRAGPNTTLFDTVGGVAVTVVSCIGVDRVAETDVSNVTVGG